MRMGGGGFERFRDSFCLASVFKCLFFRTVSEIFSVKYGPNGVTLKSGLGVVQ